MSFSRQYLTFNTLKCEKRTEMWQYRGEGNANVALSLPEVRKIIRIRKRDKSELAKLKNGSTLDEHRDVKFYDSVMRHLLDPFVGDLEIIKIDNNEIDKLNEQVNKYRPVDRCSKELDYNRSSLLNDYCSLPTHLESYAIGDTFAVEIKPKQGFVNECSKIKCFYCQNQYVKTRQGKVKQINAYCPLDLFSGDEKRIKYALKQLIKFPQNNLRIFTNGILAYGENHDEDKFVDVMKVLFPVGNIYDQFCSLLFESLTRDFSKSSNYFCDLCSKQKTSILRAILDVQQLDKYENLTAYNLNHDDWNYVNTLIDDVTTQSNCILCVLRTYYCAKEPNTEKYLIPYLISAVAKDCSVMITFGKANERVQNPCGDVVDNIINLGNGSYVFNVGVIDVYPKPYSTVKKHISRDYELLLFTDQISDSHKKT